MAVVPRWREKHTKTQRKRLLFFLHTNKSIMRLRYFKFFTTRLVGRYALIHRSQMLLHAFLFSEDPRS